MSRKKISYTVYFTQEQVDGLKFLHERTRIPVAVFVREAIDLVLEKYKSELPPVPVRESPDQFSGD